MRCLCRTRYCESLGVARGCRMNTVICEGTRIPCIVDVIFSIQAVSARNEAEYTNLQRKLVYLEARYVSDTGH
jgi:hypothetical protein